MGVVVAAVGGRLFPVRHQGVGVALYHVHVLEVVPLLEVLDGVDEVGLRERRPVLGESIENGLPQDEVRGSQRVRAVEREGASSPTRRWTVQATAAYLNTAVATVLFS